VEEQRWSALSQVLLMLVALAAFHLISWIPWGALLLYLGSCTGTKSGSAYTFALWSQRSALKSQSFVRLSGGRCRSSRSFS
jgi:hypothetical protein